MHTNHSLDRFYYSNRIPKEEESYYQQEINRITKDTLDSLLDNDSFESGNILTHSKSTGIGLVFDFQRENKKLKLVTILPIRKNHYAKNVGDVLLFVEQDVLDSLPKSLQESVMEEGSCYTKKLYDDSILAVLFEGNYYDGDFEVILVD